MVNLADYKEDNKKRLLLEVDLDYPQKLHNLDNEFPLTRKKSMLKKICYQIIMNP